MQHLQKTGGGVPRTFRRSALRARCFPSLVTCHFFRPLLSMAYTLFQVPYLLTPLLATLTKTAGCIPTIPILELAVSPSPPQNPPSPALLVHELPLTSRGLLAPKAMSGHNVTGPSPLKD